MGKAREFQKNIYFCFIDYAKAFNCVDHNKLWKILKEMGQVSMRVARGSWLPPAPAQKEHLNPSGLRSMFSQLPLGPGPLA